MTKFSSAKECVLKNTYKGSARMKEIIELKCRLEGFTEDEIKEAFSELRKEGEIYVCRIDSWIKKT